MNQTLDNDRTHSHNVLMSLPTSLVHCILSDWLEYVPAIRLDLALVGSRNFHPLMLDILESNQFYIKEIKQVEFTPPKRAHSQIWSWLTTRRVKVLSLEPHEKCDTKELALYLQKFGQHVKRACPNDDVNQHDRRIPKQSLLFANYCSNLSYYICNCCLHVHDDSILRTLVNNVYLERLDLYGTLLTNNFISSRPGLELPHLKILKRGETYGIGRHLTDLVKTAPNLQVLSIYCNPYKCTHTDAVVLDVAAACPQLRTFSSEELHLGARDRFLRPFLATCSKVVNLGLYKHAGLSDAVLIKALSELKSLYSLDLRGCCRLTDKTLQFLAQCYADTLHVLYLDHSQWPEYYYDDEEYGEGYERFEDEEEDQDLEEESGYTTAGIASLRAHCTHLHTFHYSIDAGTVALSQHVEAYQNATIVSVCGQCDKVVPLILAHCHQMQILAMPFDEDGDKRVWLTVDQLMSIVAHFPLLRVVVSESQNSKKYKEKMDYRAVKKAFPKLVFTDNMAVANFDVLDIPVKVG